jgi:hypothetical protein
MLPTFISIYLRKHEEFFCNILYTSEINCDYSGMVEVNPEENHPFVLHSNCLRGTTAVSSDHTGLSPQME